MSDLYVQGKKISINYASVGSSPAPESSAIVGSEIAKIIFMSPRLGDGKNIEDHRTCGWGNISIDNPSLYPIFQLTKNP